jgi:hypothetical protein
LASRAELIDLESHKKQRLSDLARAQGQEIAPLDRSGAARVFFWSMKESFGRGAPSALRGRLAEVYFPALVSSQSDSLAERLGERATVDDPVFGRASGLPEITARLRESAAWLATRDPSFESNGLIAGSDRDVNEGFLSLRLGGETFRLPVAVVAERRREREVILRLYYSTKKLLPTAKKSARAALSTDGEVVVPPPVKAHIDALERGNLDAVVRSFEEGATVRDAAGETHAKLGGGGPLRAYFERRLDANASSRGMQLVHNARADDGRACALEYTVVCLRGEPVPPRPCLAVYERGESGLLRTVRLYDDVTD